jgi:hypothetical protein
MFSIVATRTSRSNGSSSARPNGRIEVIRSPRKVLAIARHLRESFDAIVVRGQAALRVPFAIAAIEG